MDLFLWWVRWKEWFHAKAIVVRGGFWGVEDITTWVYALGALLVSFLLANVIAWMRYILQQRRIARKTQQVVETSARRTIDRRQDAFEVHQKKIPVTILTGFLGSGKTTMLNHILTSPDMMYRIMIIENEFGAISIDHSLLKPGSQGRPGEGIMIMKNGCICCSVKGSGNELERILDHLLELSTTNTSSFDYLVIETSGLSDPGPIIRTFLQLRSSLFVLDGVVTLIDSKSYLKHLSGQVNQRQRPVEAESQLIYADVVILNKCDLLTSSSDVALLKQEIAKRNADAQLITSQYAIVDIARILHIQTFNLERFNRKETMHGALDIGLHTSGIHSIHFVLDVEVNLLKLQRWLTRLIDEHANSSVFRIKGILFLSGNDFPCIVQGVLDTYTITPTLTWDEEAPRTSKLVIIGHDLDRDRLWEEFKDCIINYYDVESVDYLETKAALDGHQKQAKTKKKKQ